MNLLNLLITLSMSPSVGFISYLKVKDGRQFIIYPESKIIVQSRIKMFVVNFILLFNYISKY